GVMVDSAVVYGTPTLRNLYINPGVLPIGTGYASVAGRNVTPLSADFQIGNPNTANYPSIQAGLPQGWTIPATAANVAAFWMQKNGTAVFSVSKPTTGYNAALPFFAAVQGTLASGAADPASPVTVLPTAIQNGQVVVSVPLGTYANGATVALVQPSRDYGNIPFDGPPTLPYDLNGTTYTIPYTASYDMPEGFQALLETDGDTAANTAITFCVRPDPATAFVPGSLTIASDIFDISGAPVWDPVMGAWAVPLTLKTGWDTTENLDTTFEFHCTMDAADFADGGVLTLTGQLILKETAAGGGTFIAYGTQADTLMRITYYTATFKDHDGTQLGEVTDVISGETVADGTGSVPANPSRDGYRFMGWSDGTTTYAPEAIPDYKLTGNVTFTAQYAKTYTAAFEDYDGTGLGEVTGMIAGETVADGTGSVPANPSRDGYTFVGWSDGTTTYLPADIPAYGMTDDVTFTAQYLENFTATFKDYDGTGLGQVTDVADGSKISTGTGSVPANPDREGYTFIGWSDGTTTYAPESIPDYKLTGDVTFTAQYDQNVAYITVKYNGNENTGGTAPADQTVAAGTAVIAADNTFTKDGYTFSGWNTAEDGSGTAYQPGDTVTTGTADMTLFAQWVKNETPAVTGDAAFANLWLYLAVLAVGAGAAAVLLGLRKKAAAQGRHGK
ncbi:MAG: InlB B-repeat-containing protein, partial [Oscillospiraceae bacterium]|nr:InlB B-repeat-containing protein [Oscillospiraceae bacterium]